MSAHARPNSQQQKPRDNAHSLAIIIPTAQMYHIQVSRPNGMDMIGVIFFAPHRLRPYLAIRSRREDPQAVYAEYAYCDASKKVEYTQQTRASRSAGGRAKQKRKRVEEEEE